MDGAEVVACGRTTSGVSRGARARPRRSGMTRRAERTVGEERRRGARRGEDERKERSRGRGGGRTDLVRDDLPLAARNGRHARAARRLPAVGRCTDPAELSEPRDADCCPRSTRSVRRSASTPRTEREIERARDAPSRLVWHAVRRCHRPAPSAPPLSPRHCEKMLRRVLRSTPMLLPLLPDAWHGRFHGYDWSIWADEDGQVEFMTASSTMPARERRRRVSKDDDDDERAGQGAATHRARR